MKQIEEVLHSSKKPKQKVDELVKLVKGGKISGGELVGFFEKASDVDKGTCATVMKHVSESNPEILGPHIDTLIKYVDHRAPRVKWGIPEALGNMASKYPKQVEGAVDKLWQNARDKSTVVRWCAAFALTKIAIYNRSASKRLAEKFKKYVSHESNNGVKNVYLKALKTVRLVAK